MPGHPCDPAVRGRPSWSRVVASALAAAFGVQSQRNRERDFQGGSPWMYLVVGVLLTVLFVWSVKALVALVVSAR